MTVAKLERQIERKRKTMVTVTEDQKKEAYDRGFDCFNKGIKSLGEDKEYSAKLFKLEIADMLELSGEWCTGFGVANFTECLYD